MFGAQIVKCKVSITRSRSVFAHELLEILQETVHDTTIGSLVLPLNNVTQCTKQEFEILHDDKKAGFVILSIKFTGTGPEVRFPSFRPHFVFESAIIAAFSSVLLFL